MRFLSIFSGIEAASVAWKPLGWTCVGVAEIDPFPCAVLSHHYPDVPNLGSVTDITDEQIAALGPIDVVVGGSPCQDLSVAGKRAGLAGERSGLFHEQLRIFHAARHLCGARFLVWENVPGAFSSHGGRDFAVVVGAMAGCRVDVPEDGWGTEGVALGEHGLVEWAVLDAQWFGVAQRRRRVFAVLDVGDWAGRPPILLEPDRLRGDSAPSREARKDAAGSTGDGVARCLTTGEARRQDWETCNFIAHTLRGEGFDAGEDGTGRGTPIVPVAVDVWNQSIDGDVAATLNAESGAPNHSGPKVMVPVAFAENSRAEVRLEGGDGDGDGAILVPMVAPTLRAGGNRTGGDRPPGTDVDTAESLVVTHAPAIAFMADDYKDGGYEECDTSRPLTTSADRTRAAPVIAFSGKDYGADAGEVAPTLRSMSHDASHANGGGQVAVAFNISGSSRQDFNVRPTDVAACLSTKSQEPSETTQNSITAVVASVMQVRRLTPVECSRLQGFPDDYLLQVPWRGKATPPDGPMYKALGNSFAVPCVSWIGKRLQMVAEISNG